MFGMQWWDNFNYVYRVELLVIVGVILLLLYIFYELRIFGAKKK